MQYIATFFSHFGAVRFQHLCTERGWQAQVRPVRENGYEVLYTAAE